MLRRLVFSSAVGTGGARNEKDRKAVLYWYVAGFLFVGACLAVPYETYETMLNRVRVAVVIWFAARLAAGAAARLGRKNNPGLPEASQPKKNFGDYILITLPTAAIFASVVLLLVA